MPQSYAEENKNGEGSKLSRKSSGGFSDFGDSIMEVKLNT